MAALLSAFKSPNRIFNSFRGKLVAALLIFMLIPGVAGLLVYSAVAERTKISQRGYALERAGLLLRDAALAADQFANLAQRDMDFFRTGAHSAINQWRGSISEAHSVFESLERALPPETRGGVEKLHSALNGYSAALDRLPPLLRQRGLQDFGLVGEMREAIHALEDALQSPELMVHMLMLRRHEKDYIIRNLPRYTTDLRERAELLRQAVEGCGTCSVEYRSQISMLLDRYLQSFDAVVAIDRDVGVRSGSGLYGELKLIESDLWGLHSNITESFASAARNTAEGFRKRLIWVSSIVLLLSLVVCAYLANRLTAPLAHLSRNINRFVGSRFSEPVDFEDLSASDDEVNQIARDFSAMQDAIQRHLGELDSQQRELKDLNRALESERKNLSVAQQLASLGYWHYEPRRGDFSLSAELRRMFELDAEELMAFDAFADLAIHDDSRETFTSDILACQQNGRPIQRVYRAHSQGGKELWIRQYLQLDEDELAGASLLVAAVQNITPQYESEQEIRRLAYYDSLTGLSQRSYLFQRLEELVRTAKRREERFALFFIDLNKFKEINDTLGHEAGDQLLIEVSRRLQGSARESDFAARLGGDEFCLLVDNVDLEDDVADIAERLLEQLSRPIENQGRSVTPQASLGIAMYPDDGEEPEALMKAGDHAMYAAKSRGDNAFVFHEHKISAAANLRLKTSRELREAFQQEQFSIHYQPLIEIATGRVCMWEALLRWDHPERGLLPASEFIGGLQRLGLISRLGEQVIDTVCDQLAQWRDAGVSIPSVSINIAPSHLEEGTVADSLQRAMSDRNIEAGQLNVEITEAGIQSSGDVRAASEAIRALGVRIAIDDFGTGYASLASLKHLTVDCLKIDRSFVQHATSGASDRRLLKAIVDLGRSFEYVMIAEGVETNEQLELLQTLGCEFVQGYLFSRAVDPADVPRLAAYNFNTLGSEIHMPRDSAAESRI